MNDAETILMLEAQVRYLYELVKDPVKKIEVMKAEFEEKTRKLARDLDFCQRHCSQLARQVSDSRREITVHVHNYDTTPDWP